MSEYTENTKDIEIIEKSQLSDDDKKTALEYLKNGYKLVDEKPYCHELRNVYDNYYDDLYVEADPKYFLNKYIPLCNDDFSKQYLFNEWAINWTGEIVPYIKDVINMGWKINNPLPNIIYISNNKLCASMDLSPILFIACEWRDTCFITELLKNGADPNVSFNHENSLEWVLHGHNVEYCDPSNIWAYESIYECLLILEKYGLKYSIHYRFYQEDYEFINKCPIPDLKKRLESIKFK